MVVYGHARLGQLDGTGAWRIDPVAFRDDSGSGFNSYFEQGPAGLFPTPASQWHLARRSVVVSNYRLDEFDASLTAYIARQPHDPGLISGTKDILAPGLNASFDYAAFVSGQTAVDESLLQRSQLDPAPPANQAGRLGAYFLPNCASLKIEWALRVSHLPDPDGHLAGLPTIWVDPYQNADTTASDGGTPQWVALLDRYLAEALTYGINGGEYPAWRTFVENVKRPHPNGRFFGSLNPGRHEFFAADPRPTNGSLVDDPDPHFPEALRVTVDVFDDVGRLERPIRHVMVIPIGT